jgi:hypothetical protein
MSIGDQIFRPNASDNSQPQDRDLHRFSFIMEYLWGCRFSECTMMDINKVTE